MSYHGYEMKVADLEEDIRLLKLNEERLKKEIVRLREGKLTLNEIRETIEKEACNQFMYSMGK